MMNFYIKEWPNKTATLMSDNGTVLWTFTNVDVARQVCKEWYDYHEVRHENRQEERQNYHIIPIGEPPVPMFFIG